MPEREQGTETCPTWRVRDELAVTNERLDQVDPDALDLAAEVIAITGDALRGRTSQACGQHSPDYRRGQMRGRHPVTVPDLAWLALHYPEVLRAALVPLAAAVGHKLEPIPETRPWRTTVADRVALRQSMAKKVAR